MRFRCACFRVFVAPEPEATTVSTSDMTESSSGIHRGGVTSWCDFRAEKYLKKHEWLLIKPEGIYCIFCQLFQEGYKQLLAASRRVPRGARRVPCSSKKA